MHAGISNTEKSIFSLRCLSIEFHELQTFQFKFVLIREYSYHSVRILANPFFLTINLLSILLVLMATSVKAQTSPYVMQFNPQTAYTFAGLGAHVWPGANPARQHLIQDLHLTWVRAGICPTPPSTSVPFMQTTANIDFQVFNSPDSSTPALQSSMINFQQELALLHLHFHLVVWSPPPQWMVNFTYQGSEVNKLLSNNTQKYASYVTGCLLYLRNQGIVPDAVEIINEPDAYQSSADPNVYAELVLDARRKMNQSGFSNVAIEGPGTSLSTKAPAYVQVIQTSGAWSALGAVSTHDWDTVLGTAPAGVPALASYLQTLPVKPLFITETSDESPRWSSPPYNAAPWVRGAVPNASDTPEFGVAVATEAIKLVGNGAKGIAIWQLEDEPWEADSWGLLDLAKNRRPAALALQTIFGNLPEITTTFQGACSACTAAVATAFLSDGQLNIAVGNEAASETTLLLNISLLQQTVAPVKVVAVFPPQATGLVELAEAPEGNVTVTLPANSVVLLGLAQ